MYDIIGDIHGHASKLKELLQKLGYEQTETGYAHPERTVIFVGDFIDRGVDLEEHRTLLFDIVMPMVNNGHAKSVMGNHEFNCLAYHTEDPNNPGHHLRLHTDKNTKQHEAFLNEFEHEPETIEQIKQFFYTLPMWLEIDGIRVIHACWHKSYIEELKQRTNERGLIDEGFLIEASNKETDAYNQVETILKGVEMKLPEGISFRDKDNHPRQEARIMWWKPNALPLGDVAMQITREELGEATSLPQTHDFPDYSESEPLTFVGHYWNEGTPKPLTRNVTCLDYSVAKDGHLCAYRYSGETELKQENYVWV